MKSFCGLRYLDAEELFAISKRQKLEGKAGGGILMTDDILGKMKKNVYYPGNHLGKKQLLKGLVEKGLLHRADGSYLCGPDSEPNYCLTDKGILYKERQIK